MPRYVALTAPVVRRLSDAMTFISSSLDVKLFKQTFNDLAFWQKEQDFRTHFNETARLLNRDVSIGDHFVLLRFLYGSVVHRYEPAFCQFLDKWWRQTHQCLPEMDVKHVSALLYCLGRINYNQNLAVRRRLQRMDILHCENRLITSNQDVFITESWHLRRATSGMADLMVVLDKEYPCDQLAMLLMHYIFNTVDLSDNEIYNNVDFLRKASCHLANCSSILLNLTEMGVHPEETCFNRFVKALNLYNFNFVPSRDYSTKSIDIFIDLLLASDRFAQSCKLANLNPDILSAHCLTTWYLDNEQHLTLAQIYLKKQRRKALDDNGDKAAAREFAITDKRESDGSVYYYPWMKRVNSSEQEFLSVDDVDEGDKNEFRLRHVLKQLCLTVLEITVKYDRTRDLTNIFPLWRVVMVTLIDLSRERQELFLPRDLVKQTLDNLKVYATRTKRMNLYAKIERPWQEIVEELKSKLNSRGQSICPNNCNDNS